MSFNRRMGCDAYDGHQHHHCCRSANSVALSAFCAHCMLQFEVGRGGETRADEE